MNDVLMIAVTLIGGLVFFLFGMKVMSGNLEKMAGGKLEKILRKVTAKPLLSIILGAGITIAMQSSSATTVMLVGLVNSGIMQFEQTISVIFGANIGTTFTGWLLTLSGIDSKKWFLLILKPEVFSPILALVGIGFIMFSKNDRRKSIGNVFVGFAVLMQGMTMMKDAVGPLADTVWFKEILVKFTNPVFGLLIGLLLTAIIQSSAATIAILMSFAISGTGITYQMAIPIIFGLNIGTCATSLISCIGTETKAKRVAVVHVSIKIIGAIFWLAVFVALGNMFFPDAIVKPINGVGIATVHTAFNVLTTLLLIPFTKPLVKMTEFLVRENAKVKAEDDTLKRLDERILLRSPSIAIAECNVISEQMARLSRQNLLDAMKLFDTFDEEAVTKIKAVEDKLDRYEDRLGTYLVQLSTRSISDQDSRVISKMLHSINDFERLGDHAVNLYYAASEMNKKGFAFSEAAKAELHVLTAAIEEILMMTDEAYENDDLDMAAKVEPLEQVIDKITAVIKSNHFVRLRNGGCTLELGFILSDVLTHYQRISDHCSNIAVAVIELQKGSFDTHEYLNGVKCGNVEFNTMYDLYKEKYKIRTIV
ncbi:MAG: Na/Pi cotransporter family protein [Lachnospiraceae bacterium]|nr:Na/Pi cotransporter family protein [Lachnospiraceae bacterium]